MRARRKIDERHEGFGERKKRGRPAVSGSDLQKIPAAEVRDVDDAPDGLTGRVSTPSPMRSARRILVLGIRRRELWAWQKEAQAIEGVRRLAR